MKLNSREEIIALTPLWKGERFPDGRPKVPQKYLDEMQKMTLEELWKPIYLKGYESQFEGDLKTLHDDGRKLIGRAVTATYVPTRPDLLDVMMSSCSSFIISSSTSLYSFISLLLFYILSFREIFVCRFSIQIQRFAQILQRFRRIL